MKSISLLLLELFCKWLVLEKRFSSWHFFVTWADIAVPLVHTCTRCWFFPHIRHKLLVYIFWWFLAFKYWKEFDTSASFTGFVGAEKLMLKLFGKEVVRVIYWHLVYSIIEFYKRGRETKCHNVVTLWDWLRRYNASHVMSKPYDKQSVSHFSWRFSGMGRQVL